MTASRMIRLFTLVVFSAVLSGCVSNKTAALRESQAYEVGLATGNRSPSNVVLFQGSVRNHVIQWREGLTLAEAILEADYSSSRTPRIIEITSHEGEFFKIAAETLLEGEDYFLKAGDTVVIRR